MTVEEYKALVAKSNSNKGGKKHRDIEHQIQCSCVEWFCKAYPHLRLNFFAVPNGGRRDAKTGAELKKEGVLAGVSDLILLVPNQTYHALLIEMKTATGEHRKSQKIWQAHLEKFGYQYVLCRSKLDFINAINTYLNGVSITTIPNRSE